VAWSKTQHIYPARYAAQPGRPRIGEVLLRMRVLDAATLSHAVESQPSGVRLGERPDS
jgi:hypothetical protein